MVDSIHGGRNVVTYLLFLDLICNDEFSVRPLELLASEDTIACYFANITTIALESKLLMLISYRIQASQ